MPSSSAIKSACLNDDARAAQRELLAWARQCWPQDPPRSLVRIAARLQNDDIKRSLEALERSLYSADEPAWQGKELWRQLQTAVPLTNTRKNRDTEVPLPLHPR